MEHEYFTLTESQKKNVQKYITENNNDTDDDKHMYTDTDSMQIENTTNIQNENQMNDRVPETESKKQSKEQNKDLSMSYFQLYNYNNYII